ncbi:AraC family transcriptional regulator [Caulobacter sp.]|uniref:AraC family transcriptional regulator n=1 Tax=Caulobacter sp. TaxID=78 RepID=UPI0031D231A4
MATNIAVEGQAMNVTPGAPDRSHAAIAARASYTAIGSSFLAALRGGEWGRVEVRGSAGVDVGLVDHVLIDGGQAVIWRARTLEGEPTGGAIPFELHVIAVLDGQLEVQGWKTGRVLGAGAIVAMPSWSPLTILASGAAEMVVLTTPAWFAMRAILGLSAFAAEQAIPADFFCAAEIAALMVKSCDLGDAPPATAKVSLDVLATMLRQSFEFCAADAERMPTPAGRMGRLLQSVAHNLSDEDYSPRHAAQELKCSVRTIHNVCAENGTTFSHLLLEFRLRVAASSLASSRDPVSKIAFSTGFVSLSHFCRTFKAFFGVSATRYRTRGEGASDPVSDHGQTSRRQFARSL